MSRATKLNKDGSLHISEHDILDGIVQFLEAEKWEVFRTNTGLFKTLDGKRFVNQGGKRRVGFPDLVCTRPYKTFFIEVKAKGGRLSPEQEQWRHWLIERGYDWILGSSVEAVQEELKKL